MEGAKRSREIRSASFYVNKHVHVYLRNIKTRNYRPQIGQSAFNTQIHKHKEQV